MSKLTPLQATAPRKIWLQIDGHEGGHDEAFPDDTEGVTWCAEPAQACEVAYVREDLAAAAPSPAPAGWAEPVSPSQISLCEWAVSRWRDEVENRPLVNVHRRTLDDTWRQVIRFTGGDPDAAVGPSHDTLLAASPADFMDEPITDGEFEAMQRLHAGTAPTAQPQPVWSKVEEPDGTVHDVDPTDSAQPEAPAEPSEPAPPNSLPDWDECSMRVANSNFIERRIAEGGYGPEHDTKLATQLHRFIHEYDDADPYRSAWFLHRLELLLNEARATPAPVAQPPAEPTDAQIDVIARDFGLWGIRRAVRGIVRTAIKAQGGSR